MFERHLEKGGIPPTHFVVAVITKQARIIAERQDLIARDLVHPRDEVCVPHIPPRRAARHADSQHRSESHVWIATLFQGAEIAPRANGRELPELEPLQGGLGPPIGVLVMLICRVTEIRWIKFLARCPLVDNANAEGKKHLTVGSSQPKVTLALLNRKRSIRGRLNAQKPQRHDARSEKITSHDQRAQ